jgi:hypothetical protein
VAASIHDATLTETHAGHHGQGRNLARDYGVSRRWVQKLLARYQAEGEAAFEPRSRRPLSSPQRTPSSVENAIIALRKELAEQDLEPPEDR